MLSTPDVQELPDSFSHYFARATDLILTGRFYDVPVSGVADLSGHGNTEVDFTVSGLRTSDIVIINRPSFTAGLSTHARVSADNTLSISFVNTTNSGGLAVPDETYLVVAIRRERE